MHSGQWVFSQVMEHLPMKTFRRCVQRYQGNRRIQSFTCLDRLFCMAVAQLAPLGVDHVFADVVRGVGVAARRTGCVNQEGGPITVPRAEPVSYSPQ